ADLNLTSNTYPGYYSVLRNAAGTPNESAVWFVNGSFYFDHRHDDGGSVAMYALGAPLSIDWGSTYSPRTSGGYMHSLVEPEASLGTAWNADNPGTDNPVSPWLNPNVNSFAAFTASSYSSATWTTGNNTQWNRSVTSISANPNYPVIFINDTFQGPDALANKVFTLNLMAQGTVQTPSGPYNPQVRFYDGQNGTSSELPSSGPIVNLGSQPNRFSFTGQWLIDWDMYALTGPNQQQAIIGNWGHNWHPDSEQSQFQMANNRPFEERQHIFRLRGQDSFRVVVLPYRKGQQRAVNMSDNGSQAVISAPGETITISSQSYTYQSAIQTAVTTLSAAKASAFGVEISGGPTEVVISGGRVKITAHGTAGLRSIKLPGNWAPNGPITLANGVYTFNYSGGAPQTATL
ncbi:MAG: hypothetical protein M3Z09_11520, partial [Acidobacteriota bacterium]|nr:hypothetical protein [Acidobacteriota bacterium]